MIAELEGIALTSETIWENELDGWSPIAQSSVLSDAGTIVEEHTVGTSDGRPLTIIVRNASIEMVRLLEDLRDSDSGIMALELSDGRVLTGIFDHNSGPVIAEPIVKITDYTKISGLPFFQITLHLMQVM